MKQGLLTLAALSLTVAAALPASAQITGGSIRNIDQGTFNLAEAYPCASGTYAANSGITPQGVFTGTCPTQAASASLRGGSPETGPFPGTVSPWQASLPIEHDRYSASDEDPLTADEDESGEG